MTFGKRAGFAEGIKSFSCPSCGGTVEIRAAGISITAICASCGSLIDIANDNFKVIQEAAVKTRATPIALGRRAAFFGVTWEVIGYCERCDDSRKYEWREYLLFNPYQGFRFLTEADGHWNFVTMLREEVEEGADSGKIWYQGQEYRVFTRGGAFVTYVMGEFYWRVKVEEETTVADYIAPPYLISRERSGGDVVFSRAVYIPKENVALAFNLEMIGLLRQRGVAPNQPSSHAARLKRCGLPFVIAFALIMAIQMVLATLAINKVIYERTVHAGAAPRGQPLVADTLEIPGSTGNLAFSVYAPVNNDWLEVTASLVNEATQESEELTQTVEYYHGSDSDGAWSEGSQSSRMIVSAVPGGQYSLLIESDSGVWPPADFTVCITRDVPLFGLFLLATGLICAYPFWVLLRHWSFECKRWHESDHAPVFYRSNS